MKDGTLEAIFTKWGVWNEDQPPLYRDVIAGVPIPAVSGIEVAEAAATMNKWAATKRYLPSMLKASGVTIALSVLSMVLAVVMGMAIASGRVYGSSLVRTVLIGYVELMRGTPILLQLFALYY